MSAALRRGFVLALLLLVAARPSEGWLFPGHRQATIDAIGALPPTVPEFFRNGAAIAADASGDPDLWRNRGTPELADRESPEHYLDVELLAGRALPERRSDYLRILSHLHVEPGSIGTLPYAIVEGAEKLALCFAENRRSPRDAAIRTKCLLLAGWLAHFAEDLTQPLHTTIHHDGRAGKDGRSPRSGIHRKVDALIELAPRASVTSGANAAPGSLWEAVRVELAASHALVDAVYALEPKLDLPRGGAARAADPAVVAFASERSRATTRFLSALLLWSWERSAALDPSEGR